MTCPNCGSCPYLEGTCVERIARGRRFFLMGALALPFVRLKPAYEAPKLTRLGRITIDGIEWTYDETSAVWPYRELGDGFALAT